MLSPNNHDDEIHLAGGRGGEGWISARGLVVDYRLPDGNALRAVQDVSFDVPLGSRVAIVSPSGCGKSTILKVLVGLIQPTSGSVSYHHMSVEAARNQRLFGFVPQHLALLPWWTVAQNIALPLQLGGNKKQASVEPMIELFGLTGFAQYYPAQLSGGMRSRVAVARALINSPEILVLDECFGSLDELTRERLNLELSPMWHRLGTTLIFVTHSVREAVLLADRVIVLSARPGTVVGTLQVDGPQPRHADFQETPGFAEAVVRIRRMLGL